MLDYGFMVNAFLAAAIVAIMAGLVGFFLVLRGQTFAGHALSHVGFTGATGAVLVGASPLWGLVLMTVAAGVGMGLLGDRLQNRDVAIGIVLSLSLGLGLLFLHFFTSHATQATALLFGNILGVNGRTLWTLLALGLVSLAGLAVIARPLLFASLQPEQAEAKGVSLRLVSLLFLHFFTSHATQATALLFGNILGVNGRTLWTLLALGLVSLAGLAVIARPLLFASLQPEQAEAKGVSLRLVSVLFLAIVALTTAQCAQIVGVLLVFTLMVGPAATAQRLTPRLGRGLALAAAIALAQAWLGLTLAYYTDWPTSFWITALGAAAYLAACLPRR